MKKFYFLAAMAAVALSGSAAQQTVSVSHNTSGLTPLSIADYSAPVRVSAVDAANEAAAAPVRTQAPTLKADEDDFVSIGTGTWVEGPLDYYSDIKAGEMHQLEIYQSQSNPDLYCMTPYGTGSQPATLLGRANTNKFYVNVANPEKVTAYGDGSNNFFTPFNGFQIAQYTAEVGFSGASGYGTYSADEKIINFPANSFAIYASGGWRYTNTNGKFQIYLPGADVKDYSFSSTADLCNDNNEIHFSATVGPDVATLKYMILADTYQGNAANLAIVAKNGNDMVADMVYTFTDEPGVYTIFLAAADADGNVVGGTAHWVHILADDAENWESIGTGVWTDPLLVDGLYSEETFDQEVDVQRNIENPALLRISSPYVGYSKNYVTHVGHEHYIYIDVTDPENVKVELSLVGFDGGYGHMRVWSVNSRYSNTVEELREYGYDVASYDAETNTITFPSKSLQFSEPEYAEGTWYNVATVGKLVLPAEEEEEVVPEVLDLVYWDVDDSDNVMATRFVKQENLFTAGNVEMLTAAEDGTIRLGLASSRGDGTTQYYGAPETTEIEPGVAHEFIVGTPTAAPFSWTIAPGCYDVEVDFTTHTVKFTRVTSGIEGVGVETVTAPIEYFNLQGVRVAQPTTGLYITRQGTTVTKQIIK